MKGHIYTEKSCTVCNSFAFAIKNYFLILSRSIFKDIPNPRNYTCATEIQVFLFSFLLLLCFIKEGILQTMLIDNLYQGASVRKVNCATISSKAATSQCKGEKLLRV